MRAKETKCKLEHARAITKFPRGLASRVSRSCAEKIAHWVYTWVYSAYKQSVEITFPDLLLAVALDGRSFRSNVNIEPRLAFARRPRDKGNAIPVLAYFRRKDLRDATRRKPSLVPRGYPLARINFIFRLCLVTFKRRIPSPTPEINRVCHRFLRFFLRVCVPLASSLVRIFPSVSIFVTFQ